jgi:hypothetical protein
MNIFGWLFMIVSWSIIAASLVYCMYKVITSESV